MRSKGRRGKALLTAVGPMRLRRAMFRCPRWGESRYPVDEALDVVGTGRSPGLRRMMARAGSRTTFKEAAEDLAIYAGIRVSAKDVERVAEAVGRDAAIRASSENRIAESASDEPIVILYVSYDGTGVPMTRAELVGRKGRKTDGTARTREAKLGCVFTQTTRDSEGRPCRDPDSTSYVGAIESSDEFGWRIYTEARRRGLDRAALVVTLGDGAAWIRTIAELHFPGAIQIVDIYHARQHVAALCALLLTEPERARELRESWWTLLDQGRVEEMIRQATNLLPEDPVTTAAARKELACFRSNGHRMRYDTFRSRGLFVGSGVVESGCKSVIDARLKQPGMEWSLPGANAIIALNCIIRSGRFDDYWESQVPHS